MSQSPSTDVPDDFIFRSSNFVDWFNSSKGARLSPKILLADLRSRDAGRGVTASEDIAEDEELFAIPRSLVLDPTTSDIPKDILRHIDSQDSWSLLIVSVIFEYLRGEASRWHPYFKVLPTSLNTLMFWSEAELRLLQGSAVLEKIGRDEAEEKWRNSIIPVMLQHEDAFLVPGGSEERRTQELIELAHLAGSLVMAYAFDIDRDNGTNQSSDHDEDFAEDDEENPLKGMVPLADMLNADADRNNARLFQEDDYLIMRSVKAIRKSEEIFNDYGPLPRSDLLRMYGYITDNYAQYDVIEISFELLAELASTLSHRHEKAWEEKLDYLQQQEFYDDGYAIPRPEPGVDLELALPEELRTTLKVLCASQERLKSIKGSVSIKEATLLAAVLEKRLRDYPTTLAEDQQLLRDLENGSVSPPTGVSRTRFVMAIKVRKGEKEVYEAVIQLCRAQMEKIPNVANGTNKRLHEASVPTSNDSPAKKAKKDQDDSD